MESTKRKSLNEIIKSAETCPFCGSKNTYDPKFSGMGSPNKKCKECGETWNSLHIKHDTVMFKHYF
mgnify:CR=1 FL=1